MLYPSFDNGGVYFGDEDPKIAITLVFTDEAICIRPESLEMTKLDEANKYVASSTVVLLISETILDDLLDISLMWEAWVSLVTIIPIQALQFTTPNGIKFSSIAFRMT